MSLHQTRTLFASLSCVLTLLGGTAARADDTEIFTGNASNSVRPNIMLVLDTSGSMMANVTTQADYDPAQTYDGSDSCDDIQSRVYYSTDGRTPSCGSNNWFPLTRLKCRDAVSGPLAAGGAGRYIGN